MATTRKMAVDDTDNPFVDDAKNIVDTPLNNEVEKSYIEYSLSVVFSRALPNAIDGMKPVQRRILFAMHKGGYTNDKNYVKSARPVAATMGSYHPHGDSSIYTAMVNMAQSFRMNIPYIDGYGNWGDAGGSGAAASRYTECRLAKESYLVLDELRHDAVNMVPNFDKEEVEPSVLPVQFPTLLVNGNSGIAVGYACEIPQHNPGEVVEAARYLLKNPDASIEKLMKYMPGPDFPTAGLIIGTDGIKEYYETGTGSFLIRAKGEIESMGRGKHRIVFTELPIQTNTEKLTESVKKAIEKNKVQGIADVRDLTDRKRGTRYVVELKAGINPDVALTALYKNTLLEKKFNVNNTVLAERVYPDGRKYLAPQVLGVKALLEIFLDSRRDIVKRRSQFKSDKAQHRAHLLDGLTKVLLDIDKAIKIIRNSENPTEAREGIMKAFKLDEEQANYILDIPLRRLTKMDRLELEEEIKNLKEEIARLKPLIEDAQARDEAISEELLAVKKVINKPRRSKLVDGSIAEIQEEAKATLAKATAVVEDGPCFVNFVGDMVSRSAEAKSGTSVPATIRGEFVAVTNKGRGFKVSTLYVSEKDAPIDSVLPTRLDEGEKVIALASMSLEDGKTGGLAMGTKSGNVKVQSPSWPKTQNEFKVIALEGDDEILGARWIGDNTQYDFVFIASDSSLLTFSADKVRPQGSLTGAGVAGVKFDPANAEVIDFSVISHEEKEAAVVVSVSDAGNAKFTPYALYPQKGRATGGVRSMKFLKNDSKVAFSTVGVDPVLYDANGEIIDSLALDSRRDGSGKPISGIPVRR